MPKQLSFFKPKILQHGGGLSRGRRRKVRPLDTKAPLHITLRSQFAVQEKALTKHRSLIRNVIKRSSRRFNIRVYEFAICSNHIHLLIRGYRREQIQNFFRVFAGHIAQEILRCTKPLPARELVGCRKNHRVFWEFLIYSRVITWGREYAIVKHYIVRNILEALNLLAYRPRAPARAPPPGSSKN